MPMHMTKVPEWPRPHNRIMSFAFGLESGAANNNTIVPLVSYDEGLGVINTYKSNVQNASFAEYAGAKCYPTSRINKIFAKCRFSLSKEFFQTDKMAILRFATMDIHTSFMEDELAKDEVSTLDLSEVLELQNEATDRQTFPLYNGIKLKANLNNAALDLEVGQDGLTTDLEIEGTAFSEAVYYDCLQYYTNGKKLRNISSGLQWHTLDARHPSKTVFFHQHSNTKFMNPYAFLGAFIYCPLVTSYGQYGKAADTTDVNHLECEFTYRYNEFNHEFNHSLQ